LWRYSLPELRRRGEASKLTGAAKIGVAAERIMQAHHAYRYCRLQLEQGRFSFEEDPLRPEHEKRIKGKYLSSICEASLGAMDAVRKSNVGVLICSLILYGHREIDSEVNAGYEGSTAKPAFPAASRIRPSRVTIWMCSS
jgi:hypothetical protein